MNMTFVTILAVFMIGMGVGFIYFIVRENERPVPKGGVQWAAVGLSGLLVVFSGFLLALTLAPTEDLDEGHVHGFEGQWSVVSGPWSMVRG